MFAFSCIFLIELNSFTSPYQKSLPVCPGRGAVEWVCSFIPKTGFCSLVPSEEALTDMCDINW